ncbi:hypothetical protein FDP22_20145 (plasmid) [Paroceanicella profunda]|uniref:Uncharacterized protein n=1 Tax=Paroceanicella profunda TaxID=2579971 RepID=A0A5B8FJD1_9RHOB|nr:hypothetical protein [Paroceanicella profunda]QDL94168.1 hypothetical protein FDP22_20145 [Paroceanicella profunda]
MTDWLMAHDGARVRHAARGAADADFGVVAEWSVRLDGVDAGRFRASLARQVRQDLWRALARVRGFSPVVEVSTSAPEGGAALLEVTAGGALRAGGRVTDGLAGRVSGLIGDEARRARWVRHALRRARGPAKSAATISQKETASC